MLPGKVWGGLFGGLSGWPLNQQTCGCKVYGQHTMSKNLIYVSSSSLQNRRFKKVLFSGRWVGLQALERLVSWLGALNRGRQRLGELEELEMETTTNPT